MFYKDGKIDSNRDGKVDKDGRIDGDGVRKQKDNEAVAGSPCGAAFAR